MKNIFFTTFLVTLLTFVASAQQWPDIQEIDCQTSIERIGDQVHIVIQVNPENVRIPSQGMLVLTPTLTSPATRYVEMLTPAVLVGGARMKAIQRELAYGNRVFQQTPQVFEKVGREAAPLTLTYTIPYQEWLRGAELVLMSSTSGCVDCAIETNQQTLSASVLPHRIIFTPDWRADYVVPEAEIKERSENFVCMINYQVAKYDLLVDFGNNRQVLMDLDEVIDRLQNDPNLTITWRSVVGYASPEGNFDSNLALSRNRAKAFLDYLQKNYRWDTDAISSAGRGEDWDGLRQAVLELGGFPDQQQIVSIIDGTTDIARRKQQLRALSGGTTYKRLLEEVYPPLRRNEFEVSYIVRAFDVEEAREVIRTQPQMLNLNEMFLVANSYPKESREFKEVFDIATRLYPENEVSRLNAAAMEIEVGSVDMALRRLADIESPEAWNNAGVAYAKRGEYARAREYFQRAAAGSANARHNLDQLEQLLASQED